MHILLTGASGTIGAPLKKYLESQDHQVTAWNRQDVPIDNYHRMEHYLRAIEPDVVFHLAVASQPTSLENEAWMVTYEWTSELAWLTKILDIQFIFISTVAVFSRKTQGPFTVASLPDAEGSYGHIKKQAENHTFYQNPKSIVVRLGWQIGDAPGSNNMVDWLDRKMKKKGRVKASRKWMPACSFIEDTVPALAALMDKEGGLYLLDSNERWSFFEIVTALNEKHGNNWVVKSTDKRVFDQRMQDDKVEMPALNLRLPTLL